MCTLSFQYNVHCEIVNLKRDEVSSTRKHLFHKIWTLSLNGHVATNGYNAILSVLIFSTISTQFLPFVQHLPLVRNAAILFHYWSRSSELISSPTNRHFLPVSHTQCESRVQQSNYKCALLVLRTVNVREHWLKSTLWSQWIPVIMTGV